MKLLPRKAERYYFVSIFIIVPTLFIVFSSVLYRHYAVAYRLDELTLYNYEVGLQSRLIIMNLIDMESSAKGYLLSGEKSFLHQYERSQKKIEEQVNSLLSYAKNDITVQENVPIWLQKIKAFSALLNSQIEDFHIKSNPGFSGINLNKQKQYMDELRELLETQMKTRLDNLQEQTNQSREAQQNFKYILVIGTALAIGGMLAGTLLAIALVRRSEKAEEEARFSENRFLTVMNGIDDGLYDFNFADGTVYYSPSYKAMLGYTDEEHPNTIEIFKQLLHPDDVAQVYEKLRKYREGEIQNYANIFRMQHKDGNWLWVLSRGVGIKDGQEKMVRFIGTHTDITEQKNHEEELGRLNEEMENFTYITSHDLRVPLVNLKGFATEMQHAIDKINPIIKDVMFSLKEEDKNILKQALEQDIPESLRFIVQSVERMDALTTAVLDLSRIGRREYHFKPVDTQSLIERCLDTLGYEINKNNIEVTYGHLPLVNSDQLALEQIFTNVIDNAVKYLDPARNGKIRISAKNVGNQVVFSIEDNGRGIAVADREKVFQIFRRARNTFDIRGLGMGMTFVQATLRKIGGSIWFDSEPGIGTTFYISLSKHIRTKGQSP